MAAPAVASWARAYLYVSHALVAFGDRLWQFAVTAALHGKRRTDHRRGDSSRKKEILLAKEFIAHVISSSLRPAT